MLANVLLEYVKQADQGGGAAVAAPPAGRTRQRPKLNRWV
jgi:hypothetical protein